MRINPIFVDDLRELDKPEWYSAFWRNQLAAVEQYVGANLDVATFRDLPEFSYMGLSMPDFDLAFQEQHEMHKHDGVLRSGDTTDVHHAYHLWRAGWPKSPAGKFLEWGGGYGNMARITRLFDEPPAHVIVDAPVMLGLQGAFLHECGATRGVWLCPLSLARPEYLGPIDTFMGAFSVDETARECQDYLFDVDWFDASTVLIAMTPDQDLIPEAVGLRERLLGAGFSEESSPTPRAIYMRRVH